MPPTFRLDGGNTLIANRFQHWLWDCWKDYCEQLDAYNVEAILLNGDIPQGINSKDLETLTANESDQTNFALAVLEPLIFPNSKRRCADVMITRGSGFHDGKAGERAETIGREIGATKNETGQHSAWTWWREWRGKILHATHHIAVAQVYPYTPLAREMREAKERAIFGTWILPDVDIRSHVHTCHVLEDNHNRFIATAPAWQLATAWGHTKAPAKIPDIGGLVLWLDDKNKLHIERFLYPIPMPEATPISPLTNYLTPSNRNGSSAPRGARRSARSQSGVTAVKIG